ncbi:MAG: DNA photolyase [Calditrichaeota bacterium]|nr:MAG: DNA photolyase [Calditrichota bacterium]
MTRRILQKFPHQTIEYIDDANQFPATFQLGSDEKWNHDLLLAKQRGPFLRLCPGTQKHLCCLYHNLDVAAGCDLGCSYCILQGYLHNPLITIYCNIGDMFTELDNKLSQHPNSFYRIGTGELTDSLTLEPISELGPELVTFISKRHNAIIELKSKNVHLQPLLSLRHKRRTVLAWSLNAETVTQSDEGKAASIEARLAAAREAQNAGYKLAFHFDPMIDHENWQIGYRDIVERIFSTIQADNIAWISLGALRYPSAFDEIMRANHPRSRIFLGELLPGVDKKLRYFRPIRVELFRAMYSWIRSYSSTVFVYLCMESRDVWQKAFGWAPRNSAELKSLLDDCVLQ